MADFQRNGFDFKALAAPKNPMADMAKDTGGLYIDAQDSVKRPLEQMLQDMTTFYEASYIPPIQDYDGSFRTIAGSRSTPAQHRQRPDILRWRPGQKRAYGRSKCRC